MASPNEEAHFAYVQSLVERHRLPGDAAARLGSTEQGLATVASGSDVSTRRPQQETRMGCRRLSEVARPRCRASRERSP